MLFAQAEHKKTAQENCLNIGVANKSGDKAQLVIGLNKIPPISFMVAFTTSLLFILDPNTHSDTRLG